MLIMILTFIFCLTSMGEEFSKQSFENFSQLEAKFSKESDPTFKAELAYLLSFSPKTNSLENSKIYYAKYALKNEKNLSTDKRCSLNILLGNYFQDIFSYEKSEEYYRKVTKDCSIKDNSYVSMRKAWNLYGRNKKELAYQQMLQVKNEDLKPVVLRKAGFIWIDVLEGKKSKMLALPEKIDDHFANGIVEFLKFKKDGMISQKNYIRLANEKNSILQSSLYEIRVKLKTSCDIKFLTKLDRPDADLVKKYIKECSHEAKPNHKVILDVLEKLDEKDSEYYEISAVQHDLLHQPELACQKALTGILQQPNESFNNLILRNCHKKEQIRPLLKVKYVKNEVFLSGLLKILKNDFDEKMLDQLVNLDANISQEDSFDFLALYKNKLSTEIVDKLSLRIHSDALKIALIPIGLTLKLSEKLNLCKLELKNDKELMFFKGVILMGRGRDLRTCYKNFYLKDQSLFASYIDQISLKENVTYSFSNNQVDFLDNNILLPDYKRLLPKEKYKDIRKELYILSVIKSKKSPLRKDLSEQKIYTYLSSLKTVRDQINRHNWRTKNLYSLANRELAVKINQFILVVSGSLFDQKQLIDFMEKLKNA